MNLQAVLEGLLFVVGDEGLTLDQICDVMEIDKATAKELLMSLKQDYESDNRGLRVSFLGDAFKLTTKVEHKAYYEKLVENPVSNMLSEQALEVLAIVAYNQPITRAEVDNIRGVNSSYAIRKLVLKGLLKEAGKSDMPGRPNLYCTTREFLDYFGLATINDLPKMENKSEEQTETDLFTSIYKEENVSND